MYILYSAIIASILAVIALFSPVIALALLAVIAGAGVLYASINFFAWLFSPSDATPNNEPSELFLEKSETTGITLDKTQTLAELANVIEIYGVELDDVQADTIESNKFVDPVIASDLQIYDRAAYHGGNTWIAEHKISPTTREPFLQEPFPFSFKKMRALCEADKKNTMEKLLELTMCPVTKKIMQDPKIAHLTYKNQDFVLVCDEIALQYLKTSNTFKVISRIDFSHLQPITTAIASTNAKNYPHLNKLKATFATKNDITEKMWLTAYQQSKENFASSSTTKLSANQFSLFHKNDAKTSNTPSHTTNYRY
jgi:hypothetical protein